MAAWVSSSSSNGGVTKKEISGWKSVGKKNGDFFHPKLGNCEFKKHMSSQIRHNFSTQQC